MFNSSSASLGTASRGTSRVTAPDTWSDFANAVRLVVRTLLTRRDLPELSDHMLADIGVTRSAALAEAARLPWDLSTKYHR
jgi:uncharacterized protein YjiS (DUF1127 family)